MKRFFCTLLVLALTLSFLPAYAEDIPAEPTHITVGSMTKVNGAFFTNQFGSNTSDMDVRAMLHGYSPIVWTTQLDFIPDPKVVTRLTTGRDTDGNTVYTFTLADDLRWNDGTELSAADFVFSYLLQAAPQFAEIGGDTDVWNYIVGYDAYSSGETDCLQGVRLLDTNSFSIAVSADYLPYFFELAMLETCPYPIGEIAPGCEVQDTEDGAAIRNKDPNAAPIFTGELLEKTILNGYLSHPQKVCGPYSMTAYDPETGVVDFALNPWYKGDYTGTKPTIDTVRLIPVADEEIAAQMQSGEVGLVNKVVRGETIRTLTEMGEPSKDYPRLGYGYLSFACEQGPEQFQLVRQAIACCVDAERFVQDYLQGYGQQVYGYYGIGQWMTMAAMGKLEPENLTKKEKQMWESVSLKKLDPYAYDLDRAQELLIADGWTLNAEGGSFNPEQDSLRYKDVDGTLMPLSFTFGLTEGNEAAHYLAAMLRDSFQVLGAELYVTEAPFAEILDDSFREDGSRSFDISFLASNFVSVYDAYTNFCWEETETGSQNFSGIRDEELRDLAWDMHRTPKGDVLTYLQRWQAFQERYNAILPTLPLYSNTYYDFFTEDLHNYDPAAHANWPGALLHATLGEEAE